MSYISRSDWGARAPTRTPIIIAPHQRKGTVIHWNGPPLYARGAETVRALQRFHMDTKDWSDLAYSWLVDNTGDIYEVRGFNWDQFANGQDQVGPDDGPDRAWYTIMWMGGEGETPSEAAIASIRFLVDAVRTRGADMRVEPHSDFRNKSCPGPELHVLCAQLDNQPVITLENVIERLPTMTPEEFKTIPVPHKGGVSPLINILGWLMDGINELRERPPVVAAPVQLRYPHQVTFNGIAEIKETA